MKYARIYWPGKFSVYFNLRYLKMGFKDTKKTKIIEEVAAKSKGPPIVFKRLEMDLTEFAV